MINLKFYNSLLSTQAEALAEITIENKEVSSTKSFRSNISPCGKSLT